MDPKQKYLGINNLIIKSITQEGETIKIKGYASTGDIDRDGDIIPPSVYQEGIKNYLKNPVMLFNHDPKIIVGKTDILEIEENGLLIEATIHKLKGHEYVFNAVQNGLLKGLSIGAILNYGDTKEVNGQRVYIVQNLELIEISLTGIPANQNALFEVIKKNFNLSVKEDNSIDNNDKLGIYLDTESFNSLLDTVATLDTEKQKIFLEILKKAC